MEEVEPGKRRKKRPYQRARSRKKEEKLSAQQKQADSVCEERRGSEKKSASAAYCTLTLEAWTLLLARSSVASRPLEQCSRRTPMVLLPPCSFASINVQFVHRFDFSARLACSQRGASALGGGNLRMARVTDAGTGGQEQQQRTGIAAKGNMRVPVVMSVIRGAWRVRASVMVGGWSAHGPPSSRPLPARHGQ